MLLHLFICVTLFSIESNLCYGSLVDTNKISGGQLLKYEIVLPHPLNHLSHTNYSNEAKGLTKAEQKNMDGCSFVSLNPKHKIECPIERDEHELVQRFITSDDNVLELGGRFGTTSCEIAVMQNNTGRLIVVEPDKSVWTSLLYNR